MVPVSSTTLPQLPLPARPVVKARRPVPVQQLQPGIVLVVVTEVLVVVTPLLVLVVVTEVLVVVTTMLVLVVVPTMLVDVEVVATVTVVLLSVEVVVVTAFVGQVQSSWHSRLMWPGPRAGQVRLQGGSHSSPGSSLPLPQSEETVVVVVVPTTVVVVVLTPTHGSGTQLPSPPMSMPDCAAHSLGFCGSQTNAPPAEEGGRQQLMSWGVWRGVHPWSMASHKLAKELTQAVPPGGARHFAAGVMAHCVCPCGPVVQQIAVPARPQLERWAQRIAACIPRLESRPAASAFMARLTQRRYARCVEAPAQSH